MTRGGYLLFTNECAGLGHLRRALAVAAGVTTRDRHATALIVTGAPVEAAHPLPPRVDTVKLPLLARDSAGTQRAGRLAIGLPDVHALRAQLALATARSFAPSVVVVDKLPLGLGDELLPALEWLRAAGAKIVLGLRDIEDAPSRVRAMWGRAGVREAFERLYDAVLVYGPEGGRHHALACLGWQPSVPVHHVGYLASTAAKTSTPQSGDYVLATAGGGVDGRDLLATFIDAVRLGPLPVPSLVVSGPLMPESHVRDLRARAHRLDIEVEAYRPGLDATIAGARGVVSMAGYNTVAELLRAGRPALLVPRRRPSREQVVRAELLRDAGRADVLDADELEPVRMRAALERLLATPPFPRRRDFDGARGAADVLAALGHGRGRVLEEAS